MIYPIVIVLREMGLYGTLTGLVIVHTIFGMPILTLLFRNYFSSLPEELFKAARVDGAGFWQIYFRIMLPMSLPIFVVAMILQVTGIWNDFLFGVVYTRPDILSDDGAAQQHRQFGAGREGIQRQHGRDAADRRVPLIVYFVSGAVRPRHRRRRSERVNACMGPAFHQGSLAELRRGQVLQRSTSTSPTASSSCCSARPAAASRPCSTASPACSSRPTGRSSSRARTSPGRSPRTAASAWCSSPMRSIRR
jgi:hypothetical protein